MKRTQPPKLGEFHRRGISTTLTVVDEALCEFEQWAKGRETRSVLHRERNTLSAAQRRALLAQIRDMRAVLRELDHELDLEGAVQDAARAIWAKASALREHVIELESRHLRRYGQPPTGLAEYLDPRVADLVKRLDRIASAVSERSEEADPS